MRRLFVDIDDTLIFWQNVKVATGEYMGDPWESNKELVLALLKHAHNFDLYLWSGGGREYAEMWGNKILPKLYWTALSKGSISGIVFRKGNDIYVDDCRFLGEEGHYYPNDLSWAE